MPDEAFRIHGLSEERLSKEPIFAEVVHEFLEFIGDSPLIIHNAEFDMRFINAELVRLGFKPLPMSRSVDTVAMAKKRFPGSQVNLDALCRRFDVDLSKRTHHGALLDSELLAEVYLQLIGGRQPGFELAVSGPSSGQETSVVIERSFREPRPHAPSAEELTAHETFVGKLKNPIWLKV